MTGLTVTGLTKHFAGNVALDDVSFSLPAGHVLACIGHNGAGKTTLLNLLSGDVVPDHGTILIADLPIRSFSPEEFAARGVVRTFQSPPALIRALSVRDNLLLAACSRSLETITAALFRRRAVREEERKAELGVMRILNDLGASHLIQRQGDELSGGEQKLVEIATALVRRPSVLLLDEPLAELSPAACNRVLGRLRQEKARGMTAVIVEHRWPLVQCLVDGVIELRQGRIASRSWPGGESSPRHDTALDCPPVLR